MQSVTLVCISLLVLVYVYETNAIGANNRFRTVPRSFQSLSLDRRSATTNASIVWVEDFGAKGDGNTDDTASFQAALTAMGNLKGGIVMVGRGNYAIRGNLDIPMAVTLQGIYQAVPSHDVRDQEPLYEDSILLAFAGKGSDQGTAFITMHENSVLRGVAIFYPEQVNKGVPVAYPWTISMSGNNPAVYDVELLNPYQGISAVAAHRHYIARVQGQPLRVGIFIDQTYDIGRIENVHWNPWFSMDPVLLDWQQGKAALHATGGSLVVSTCDFQNAFPVGPQIILENTVDRAIVMGNLIAGKERIVNNGCKNFQQGLNAAQG